MRPLGLKKFLNSPYPFYEDRRQGLRLSLAIGFFIGFFCYLFRPLGLHELNDLSLMGFGLVTFIVCFFYMVVLPTVFPVNLSNRVWKVYKEIIWVTLINCSIAISNYFYLGWAFNAGYKFEWSIFLFVLKWTVLIAIIPAVAIIFYKQIFIYRKIVKEVERIDSKLISRNNMFLSKDQNNIIIDSDNKKDKLVIELNDFLFITSAGNYIEVFHVGEEDRIRKSLVRNNISKVEEGLKKFDTIIRCHRSHIVNLNKVHRIKGNLQGYQLFFKGIEDQIPVSRSYTKVIKKIVLEK